MIDAIRNVRATNDHSPSDMTAELVQSMEFLLAPALGAGVVIALNLLLCRLFSRLSLYVVQACSMAAGLAAAVFLLVSIAPGSGTTGRSIASALIFLAFCYVYFHFNNMGETARRIRLLAELSQASAPLSLAEISRRYGAAAILSRRLERLTAAGQVRHWQGRYFIANRSVFLMAVMVGYAHRIVFGKFRHNRLEE